MRSIIILLTVALALMGAAAAWDSTNYLTYNYQKIVNTQAGEHLDWLVSPPGTTPGEGGAPSVPQLKDSGAQFSSQGAYGTEQAKLANFVQDIKAPLQPVAGTTPDTHDVLSQGGSATTTTKAPDLENPCGIMKSGSATAYEDLHLSGNYGGAEGRDVQALMAQDAAVGVGGVNVVGTQMGSAGPDYPMVNDGAPRFTGQVEAEGGYIVDTDIGTSTTVGFQQINAPGALPTMSGMSTTWAGFSGAYNPNGMPTDIEASTAGEAAFGMFPTFTNHYVA